MEVITSEKSIGLNSCSSESNPPLCKAGDLMSSEAFAEMRRRLALEHCKWDSQVGDVCTLANFPLIMSRATWNTLATMAEGLCRETVEAGREILRRRELLKRIGLPRTLEKLLCNAVDGDHVRETPRVMRFDFHPTTEGWRISEVNSDVPGGFTEASSFSRMMAIHYPGTRPAGDPATDWCEAISKAAGEGGTVVLLTAPGFMEDHQIMAYLAGRLNQLGCSTHLANPYQLQWKEGVAFLNSSWHVAHVDAIVRFYQGEWLAKLPEKCGWRHFYAGAKTVVANPGCAIITESKRFPLVWDELETELPLWRTLLPETRDPRDAPWKKDEGWLLKSTLCNTGDTVSIRSVLGEKEWRSVSREVWWRPSQWVAQRRFQPIAVSTPNGPMHPCIGVYTINGRAAGAYARITPGQVIDFAAIDIALLIEEFDEQGAYLQGMGAG